MGRRILGLNKENLTRLYSEQQWSTIQIAVALGCHDEAVRKALNRYEIPVRTRSQASKGKPKSPQHRAKILKHLGVLHQKQKGANHPTWKGGRYIDNYGYVLIRVDGKTVKEHRYVVEQHLGYKLPVGTHVHHLDGNKQNNTIENLKVMSSSLHLQLEWRNKERRELLSQRIKEARSKYPGKKWHKENR